MSFKSRYSLRLASCLAAFAVMALAFIPSTLAVDPPAISVNPTWRPATQLSTVDSLAVGVTNPGDDLRYVDADIYVTTSVQFWAVDVTCTVDKTVLETYTPNTDSLGGPTGNGINAPDDIQPVTYGADWLVGLGYFLETKVNTVNVDGKINFAATRAGLDSPMGSNGVKKTLLLATLRYRTKVLAANKVSPLTCVAAFLDKNGKPVLVPTVVAPAPLSVITGYTIKGKATYQDQAVPTGILVDCVDSANVHHPVTPAPVTVTGDFTISTRNLGTHDCFFYGSKLNADTTITEETHLTARASFKLNSAVYNLLPVVLRSGNTDRDGARIIDFADFSAVTAGWNQTTLTAFTNGDANGDKKTDKTDLAIVSGNYFGTGLAENVNASHLIYSLPRDNEKFMNGHIWIGGYYGDPSVSQFVPGTERNYWATLSPDGAKIAFTRNIGAGNADKFALFVAPVTAGVVGAAVNITPAAAFDAFAPSWSPDGTTIAFACAYSRGDWTDGNAGHANLCLIGSAGANLRQKIALSASNNLINIHPVAWFNNTSIMYGAPDLTSTPLTATCNYQICTLNLTTMANTVDPRLPFGADMPTIRTGMMGPVVFYRFSSGYTSKLRFSELQEGSTYPITTTTAYAANCTQADGSKHCDVININSSTFPGYDKIGYFNVYTGNSTYSGGSIADNNQYGIVLYTQNLSATTVDGGGTNIVLLDSSGTPSSPAWGAYYSLYYSVNNAVGNPDLTVTDFDPSTEGFLALRNTIEWVP